MELLPTSHFPAWVIDALAPVAEFVDAPVAWGAVESAGTDELGQRRFRVASHRPSWPVGVRPNAADEVDLAREAALDRLLGGWVTLAKLADRRLGTGVVRRCRELHRWAPGHDVVRTVVDRPRQWLSVEQANLVAAAEIARRRAGGPLADALLAFLAVHLGGQHGQHIELRIAMQELARKRMATSEGVRVTADFLFESPTRIGRVCPTDHPGW